VRLVTIRTPNGTRAGRLDHDRVTELPYPDVGALLADGADGEWAAADAYGAEHALADVDLAPVVPRPSKIFCLGLNYRAHILETGRDLPTHPTLFAKFPPALIGARDDIWLPDEVERPDWEVELAFVVGRRVRRATVDEAGDAIAGYTICNDISMRDWQYRTLQWLAGKTWEHSTPLGPALVTPDEVDHAADLVVRCEVDGEVMQEARTSDLVFKPAETLAYLSTIVTMEPGDVVSTGTPGGIGDARDPKVSLRPGQLVRTSIEGLGECVNECVPDKNEAR
jgi:acylpyruvate hydrolase